MKLLKCKICMGEVDIIGNERAVSKRIKCRKCGYTNEAAENKGPEVMFVRKRPTLE